MLKIDDFSKKMPNLDIFVKKRLIRVSLLKSKDECRKNIAADHVTRGSFTGSVTDGGGGSALELSSLSESCKFVGGISFLPPLSRMSQVTLFHFV